MEERRGEKRRGREREGSDVKERRMRGGGWSGEVVKKKERKEREEITGKENERVEDERREGIRFIDRKKVVIEVVYLS
jgi:hypothetical protein